jgi:hypothetical protein
MARKTGPASSSLGMTRLLLVLFALSHASQPPFIVTGNSPEFAFMQGADLMAWNTNPAGNVFSGTANRGLYNAAHQLWLASTQASLMSTCWTADGTNWPGGGNPPQCDRKGTFGTSDVAYSVARDLYVFSVSSGGFLRSLGPPTPGSPMVLSSLVTTPAIDGPVWGICYSRSHDLFVAVGQLASPSVGKNEIVWSKDGGLTWTGASTHPFSGGNGNAVVYSCYHDRYVAVGQGAANVIAYSPDGDVWNGLGAILFDPVGGGGEHVFVNDAGQFVAGGSWVVSSWPNSTAYSSDGISWVGGGLLPGASTVGEVSGIGYSESLHLWMAVCSSGGPNIVWSADGQTWPSVNTSNPWTKNPTSVIPYYIPPTFCLPAGATALTGLLQGPLLLTGTYVVPSGGAVVVQGNVTIAGGLSVQGNLTLIAGNLSVLGFLSASSGGALIISTASSLRVSGVFSGQVNVMLLLQSVPPSSPAVYVIISYGSAAVGTSAGISALANFPDSCATVAPVASPSLGPTALTATVTVTTCDRGLSPGAIAGIAIAVIIVGAALAVLVVWLFKREISKRTIMLRYAPQHCGVNSGGSLV